MEHKVHFSPIGNADTTLFSLWNGRRILFDYANMRCADDEEDKRIDLPTALNKEVDEDYDVACFTHLDNDHICGFSSYFYLEHASAYQSEGRKKIKEMWVPANILVEAGVTDEARIMRAEARHRLKNKKGIRVFSRAKKLKDWCDQQEDICFDDIKHLIVDAGSLVPGFTLTGDGVEFFVHSPFASDSQHIDRNNEAIVVQVCFNDNYNTKILLGSDLNFEAWSDIVKITKHFKNDQRLAWDLFHISHHCSFTALSSEKGDAITKPVAEVKWLIETMGNNRAMVVSPSWSIPIEDTIQPPHKQAAAYYKKVVADKMGDFKVTMDHPSKSNPEPLVYIIDEYRGLRQYIKPAVAASFAYERRTSRAGHGK